MAKPKVKQRPDPNALELDRLQDVLVQDGKTLRPAGPGPDLNKVLQEAEKKDPK